MFSKLITEPVNLLLYPRKDRHDQCDECMELTLGDLHASALKLIYFLIKHNVIDISKEDYRKLTKIYLKSINKITSNHREEFNTIIKNAKINKIGKIRFLGDEVADRSHLSCYFVLIVIEELGIQKVNYVINHSNHGYEFILAYEAIENGEADQFCRTTLNEEFVTSLAGLQLLIDKKLISYFEVKKIVERYYKPHLKLIDYSFNESVTTLTLYTHAYVGIDTIQDACLQLSRTYHDENIIELSETAIRLNDKVMSYAKKNQLHLLATTKKRGAVELDDKKPIYQFIWNRNWQKTYRPKDHHDYHLSYIHGHDASEIEENPLYSNHTLSLDNRLGASIFTSLGEYSVYVSHHVSDASKPAIRFTLQLNQLRESIPHNILTLFDATADQLIIDDLIYSPTQIKLLYDFLCIPDNISTCSIWQTLFADNDAQRINFVQAIQKNFVLWDILYLAHKHHCLNKEIFNFLLQHLDSAKEFYLLLRELDHANLMHALFSLSSFLYYPENVSIVFYTLRELNQYDLVNEKMIARMNQCKDVVELRDYYHTLSTLHFASLVSRNRFIEIYSIPETLTENPYEMIFLLKKHKLFNETNYKKMILSLDDLPSIFAVIKELEASHLLNQTTLAKIFEDLSQIENVKNLITLLKKNRMLTAPNFLNILDVIPNSSLVLAELEIILTNEMHAMNISTDESRPNAINKPAR